MHAWCGGVSISLFTQGPNRAARPRCVISLLSSISDNGQVSILVVKGTQLVQEACTRHQTSPTASAALGRALLGTLLLAAFREQGEKTQVTFRGDGPLGGIQVIADATGTVKGKASARGMGGWS